MRFKSFALFSLGSIFACLPLLAAQIASPTPLPSPPPIGRPVEKPVPRAVPDDTLPSKTLPSAISAPSAAISPAPSPKSSAKEVPEPSATPFIRAIVDTLSPTDLTGALELLKGNYINPAALSDQELSRSTLQGLLDRLAPGVSVFARPPQPPVPSAFFAEILDERIGYLRPGSLGKSNLEQMDVALQQFNSKSLKSTILDLRVTPAGSDFDLAAEVLNRFCPKGRVLFTIKRAGAKQERIISSSQDPSFHGLLIVLVDKETAGAGEVIAAVLRANCGAMVVGENSAGQAVEYSDLALPSGKILRVAVAEIVLPGGLSIFPDGVKPDVAVYMSYETKREIARQSQEKGSVSQFVFETERTHMNEAALVAGTNPELDAMQAAQRTKSGEQVKPPLRDAVLQHAVDLITAIGIYQKL